MSQQKPEIILEQHFPPEELDYYKGLYGEGLDQPTESLRHEHLGAVAELVGDFAVYQALAQKVQEDREAVRQSTERIKEMRATEAVPKIETNGYAETAPRFEEQARDTSRSRVFMFNRLPMGVDPEGWEQETMTESQGLKELSGFLDGYIEKNDTEWSNAKGTILAEDMRENITFIGEREHSEAVRGLAATWKAYLRENPERMICVLTGSSESKKYPGQIKSDAHLRDEILKTFSEEELEEFSGRIVADIVDIRGRKPTDTRLILLDDWTISGQQIRRIYRELEHDPYFTPFRKSLEVNLVVASEERLEQGLQIYPEDPSSGSIKVKSYFKSHPGKGAKSDNKSYVSGLHSSVNYDFEDLLEDMIYEETAEGEAPKILALASIVRSYDTPKVEVTSTRLKRLE
jgi:hypothetical protein